MLSHKNWKALIFSCSILAVTLNPTLGKAQDTGTRNSVHVGGEVGAGFSNNDQGTNFTFGGRLGYNLFPNLAAAAFVDYMGLGTLYSSSSPLYGSSQSITYYGIEGTYSLKDLLMEGLGVGIKLGMASSSITATIPGVINGSNSNTQVFIGPKLQYDYALRNLPLTIGGEANLLLKSTSSEPVPGYSSINGVSRLFNLLAVVKYWF